MTTRDIDIYLGDRGFENARYTLATWQKLLVLVILAALGLLFFQLGPRRALFWLNAVLMLLFLVSTCYRFLLIDVSLKGQRSFDMPDSLEAPDGEWPHYVIQVPMYREGSALPHLIDGLSNLDYPKEKLTIQLLIEADDEETRAALEKLSIEPPFVVVDIPVSEPRTKPKACNVGLAQAEGDYLVIYDAEDRPDPDQLKKAVIAFAQADPSVVCIQAKLNFYNAERNLITRCFAAEYAMWFDLCLPGLDRLRAPIPLGGTSNHFRLDILHQLQGWDEFNVTEDCDLGLRLFSRGWRTRILESTTWEEACPKFLPWIRQRSRWVKGYMQTYLVHTRKFIQLTRQLGVGNSFHFHTLIGGSVLFQLLAPVYWFLVLLWFCFRAQDLPHYIPGSDLPWLGELIATVSHYVEQIDILFPGPVFIMAAFCLFVGNFVLVYSCAVATACRGFGAIVKYTPLMVLYWLLMSWAAWKGALQLVTNPHFWEKTSHHAE